MEENKLQPPRIGEMWEGQGGIYAGIVRGRDGAPDYHLIVGPANTEATWDERVAWVKSLTIDGHPDFALPFRTEQSICFGNVPELFERECYWTCEQHAENSDYAWCTLFYTGYQFIYHKGLRLRARAVRRLPIQ